MYSQTCFLVYFLKLPQLCRFCSSEWEDDFEWYIGNKAVIAYFKVHSSVLGRKGAVWSTTEPNLGPQQTRVAA
jgi:hypothetical protein